MDELNQALRELHDAVKELKDEVRSAFTGVSEQLDELTEILTD